jgi:2-haloacid dehalogenase
MALQALVFDTYGTLVDWRTSVLGELTELVGRHKLPIEPAAFLEAWRVCYRAGMDEVNAGVRPWTSVEAIYRRRLDELLEQHGIALAEDDVSRLNGAWGRLRPWPDTVPGLTRLKTRYIISPLSNASFAGMVHLARFARLPWDCVITAENARYYKPHPEVYRTALALLAMPPDEVMMVAAHNYDLRAARSHGMRTAFIPRPTEYGPDQKTDLGAAEAWDVIATDVEDLARRLGT